MFFFIPQLAAVKLIKGEQEMKEQIVGVVGADRDVWTDGQAERPSSTSTVRPDEKGQIDAWTRWEKEIK